MKVRFIINPAAGRGSFLTKITDAVREALHNEVGIFEIKAAKRKGHAGELSLEAVKRGYEFIYACGGDGTINEVASQMVGAKSALGIIPTGSGNGLARALGVPFEILPAINLLKNPKILKMDVGVICGRFFFATAGLGFDAHLSRKYSEGFFSRKLRGVMPYYPIAAFEFLRYRPAPVIIRSEGYNEKLTPFILTIANTMQYGGGAVIAPGAKPDDGLLDVCIVPEVGFLKAPELAMKLMSGKIAAFKGYKTITANSLEVIQKGPSWAHVDGEPFECFENNISIKVLPKRLKVLI